MTAWAATDLADGRSPCAPALTGPPATCLRVLHVLPALMAGGMERATIRLIRDADRVGVASAGRTGSHLPASPGIHNAPVNAQVPALAHGLCILQQADGRLLAECRSAARIWVLDQAIGRPSRLSTWWRLRQVIRRFRPHVVHARSTGVWVDAAMATRGLGGVKLLLSFHGKTHTHRPALRRRLLNRWAAARADAVLAVSRESIEYMKHEWGLGPTRLAVIHNGVNLDRFHPPAGPDEAARLRGELGLNAEHRLAVCVANFLPIKGIDVLIRAWQQVSARQPAARLLLVGDGPLRDSLQALAWELGCRDSVLFAGARENVPDLLRAADLFVLPSHYEACCNAILEAQASGLPVVACDTGGNPELIDSGATGWLVRPGSPDALAEGILAVLADDQLRRRIGRAARDQAVAACGEAAWLEAYNSLYLSLAITGAPPTMNLSGREVPPCAE